MNIKELQKLQQLLEKYGNYAQESNSKFVNKETLDWHIVCVKQCVRLHELEQQYGEQ